MSDFCRLYLEKTSLTFSSGALEEELAFSGAIEEIKDQLREKLDTLEASGVVSKEKYYGEILAFIARDILYRKTRAEQRSIEISSSEKAAASLLSSKKLLRTALSMQRNIFEICTRCLQRTTLL